MGWQAEVRGGQLGARATADGADREGEKRIHSGSQKGLQPQRFKGRGKNFGIGGTEFWDTLGG